MNFKTIQFDILVKTKLKGIIASINLNFFFWVSLKLSSKIVKNSGKKLKFLGIEE